MKTIYEKLEHAANNQLSVELKVKYGLGGDPITLDFQPYILGDDIFQYSFAWGFLPHNKLAYKFRLSDILSVNKISKTRFKIDPTMIYYYSFEEEHFATAPDFEEKNPRYLHGHTKIKY